MKLATLSDGSRDGQLVVVSRDLTLAHFATGMAGTMRQLLDDWNFVSPQLEDLSATLNGGKARHAFPFDPARCLPPLPRPVAWWAVQGDAAAVAQAGPARGGATRRLAALASADIAGSGPDDATTGGWRLRPALAAITGDLAADADADTALESLRLLALAGDWCGADGSAEPAFGPVAATPDELGTAWAGGRLGGRFRRSVPGRAAESFDAAAALPSAWGVLLAGLARGRPLAAGSVLVAGLAPSGADGAGRRAAAWHFAWLGESGEEALGAITATLQGPVEGAPPAADKTGHGPAAAAVDAQADEGGGPGRVEGADERAPDAGEAPAAALHRHAADQAADSAPKR
jgi:fumarylacetoacetate (FAA) hydrolase